MEFEYQKALIDGAVQNVDLLVSLLPSIPDATAWDGLAKGNYATELLLLSNCLTLLRESLAAAATLMDAAVCPV